MILADDVDTPAKFAEMIEEVKLGILEVLTAELVPAGITVGEKIPLLKNRLIVDPVPDKFAARLRSKRHKEGTGSDVVEKVHAFMVGYGGIDTNNPDNTVGRKGFRLRFLIDSYYEDDIGTDADNAEKRHGAEIARVCFALFASRVLRRPGIVQRVADFQERRGFSPMGETVMRKSLGELYVVTKAVRMAHT